MGSTSKSKNSKASGAEKEKVVKRSRKSNKQNPPSPVQKPIMSPDKEKALNKKSSNRRATKESPTEDKPRLSNRRASTSQMGAVPPKNITDKLSDEKTTRTNKTSSELSATVTDVTLSRGNEKRAVDEQEKLSRKKLNKEIAVLKQRRIQTARKLDEKVTRCRTKGRPLMAGQVDARQDIERAEANLKEWTKQFNQQMSELKEYLTKEMGEIRAGMKELEEMEIKTEMESKHVRGAKCCRTMESARE